jgi:hypothetical protein
MTSIQIPGFDGFAVLESTTGTVVNGRLSGEFYIAFRGERTDPIEFTGAGDNRVQVTGTPGAYAIDTASVLRFAIDAELVVPSNHPRVRVADLTLVFSAGKPRASLLFRRVSLSLIPGEAPSDAQAEVISPIGANPWLARTPLQPTRDEVSGRAGFPIVPVSKGWEICAGPRDNRFDISHVHGATVRVGPDATLAILIGDATGQPCARVQLVGAAPDEAASARIRIANTKSAGMNLEAFGPDRAALAPCARFLSIAGGLLSIEALHGRRLRASALDASGNPLAAVQGSVEQFQLRLKMPQRAGDQPTGEVAQLEFADDRVITDREYQRLEERFDGVIVEGLSTVRSARECLDCSHATITFIPGSRYHLRAGLPLSFLDGLSVSAPKLLPKKLPSGERRLDLLVGAMHLTTTGTFTIDTGSKRFELNDPILLGRPNGPAASAAKTSSTDYASWELRSGVPLPLSLNAKGLKPAADDWAEHFDYSSSQAFRLVEQPGAAFTMRRAAKALRVDKTVERTELTQIRDASGRDYVAVSALFATLSYLAVRHFQAGDGETFVGEKDIEFRLRLLKADNNTLEEYAKGVAPGDLRIEWRNDSASIAALENFIRENIKDGNPNPDKVLFPFHDALSVLLRGPRKDGTVTNGFEIGAERKPGGAPLLAIDFSEVRDLGLDWPDIAGTDTALWPTVLKSDSKRRDPSTPGWKGVFLRDMPLNIKLPSAALALLKDWPHLANFLEKLNDGLMLDYGWRDESGTTWSSRLEPAQPIPLCPELVQKILSIELERATFQGAAGRPVRASATVKASLPFLDQQRPPSLSGDFDFTFGGENPLGRVTLRVNDSERPIATNVIPGFDEVRLAGISSDFLTARADLELFPSAKLKTLMEVFDLPPGKPFKASLNIDLKNKEPKGLTLLTPHEIRTKLFGKWPLVVRSLRLEFGDKIELQFESQLELGFPTLRSIGAKISLVQKDQGWDFGISLSEVSTELGVGDVKATIKLGWRNDAVVKNEFWGTLELVGGPIKAPSKIQMRVGASGGRPYWIAGTNLPDVSLGVVEILDPILLIGRGAELQGLAAAIVDPSKNLKVLRDSKSGKEDEDWLKEWQPSPNVGTVFAASGFLSFDSRLAGSTKDKGDSDDGKYLTNLVFTDNGLLRIDGWFKLLGVDDLMTRIVFGLDTKRQIISAGMQLPRLKVPPDGKPEIEIFPGFAYFSFSYGGKFFFKFSQGWPPKKPGGGIERDWDQSTKVYVAEAWPINTFWGGSLVEFHAGESLTLGVALRAGWTKSYPGIGVEGIASAEAELGIALGGVLIVDFGKPQRELVDAGPIAFFAPLSAGLLPLPVAPSDHALVVHSGEASDPVSAFAFAQPYLAALQDEARALASFPELAIQAELYGDIWGRGSAVFLGVTIASVSIAAYARFLVAGNTREGITSMRSITGFNVEVTILCVRHSAHVEVDIWVIRR